MCSTVAFRDSEWGPDVYTAKRRFDAILFMIDTEPFSKPMKVFLSIVSITNCY